MTLPSAHPAVIAWKVVIGLLGFSAIVTEVATLAERGVLRPANFLSYFTIENNILAAVTLLLSALLAAAGRGALLDGWRGAVTVYILVVGIGFALLLSGLEDTEFTAVPWDNVVLHYVVPVAVLVDFVLDPPSRRLGFVASLRWLLFPVSYVGYSLVRGALTGWYPYPFLDPDTHGIGALVLTVLALLVLATALIWLVCRLSARPRLPVPVAAQS